MFHSKLFFLGTMLFFGITLFAQSTPNISLTVKDSLTNEPIGYATVEVLSSKDSLLAAGITDDKGFISIPCEANDCKIRIRFIGYKTFVAPVTARNFGVIFLSEETTQLSEVSVTASNRTIKIDRDVYVITKNLKAGVATSQELLGKLNGVMYNPYDQSLAVNGSKDVLILIDGIEKDQQLAKSLSPDRIDRVEVLKDPVGKYAADGYKAVINIITKKDFSGIDVAVNFNPMFNLTEKRGNLSPFLQENSNVNILYAHKKWNFYTSYWGNYTKLSIPIESEKQYGNLLVTTPPMDYKHPNMNTVSNDNSISVGGDYLIKTNNILALELNYNTGFSKNSVLSDLTTSIDDVIMGRNQSTTDSRNTTDALQTTLTYHGTWSEKSNFKADFRYRYSTPVNYSTFSQGVMQSKSNNAQIENFYRLNLDYTYQFTPNFSMDFGYGAIFDRYNLYQNNTTLTQEQVRNRPSLYLSYAPSGKLSVKIGAMVEFFNQKFINSEQSQTGVLPFANIRYTPFDKFGVTAKYRAYPNYPDIEQLTTFTTQMDTLTWYVGNPDLMPSNYQEVCLEFNILQTFNIEPYYGFDNSNIQQYLWEDDEMYYQTNVNATTFYRYGCRLSFTLPLTKTLFWQNWMDVNNKSVSYDNATSHHSRFQLNSILYYTIPKWDAAAGAGIQKFVSKDPTIQGYNGGGNDLLMLMLQKNFFKKRLSCTFIYVPPVNEGFIRYTQEDFIQTPTYYALNRTGLELLKNIMMLQINFHFNAGKQVSVTKSSLDDDNNTKKRSGGIGK